ncbi:hypothetical protein MHBO_004898, partial [Bonamia ostreae]
IVNQALLSVGAKKIADLDSTTDHVAQAAKLFYDAARKEIIASANWGGNTWEAYVEGKVMELYTDPNGEWDLAVVDLNWPGDFSEGNERLYVEFGEDNIVRVDIMYHSPSRVFYAVSYGETIAHQGIARITNYLSLRMDAKNSICTIAGLIHPGHNIS